MKTKNQKHRVVRVKQTADGTKQTSVKKVIRLSPVRAQHLSDLAKRLALTENDVVAKALDILSSRIDLFDQSAKRQGMSALSQHSLEQTWKNDQDAARDNSRTPNDI